MATHFFLVLVLCFSTFRESSANLFTSMAHLEAAASLEQDLVDSLQKYIAAEEERLLELSMFVKEAEMENEKAMKDVTGYIANPINSYLLIKRLFLDWNEAINQTAQQLQDNDSELKATADSQDRLPDDNDLVGASLAIMRLQNTYDLDLEDLARGNIRGNKVALLGPSDFLDIGKVAFDESDYYNAAKWLEAALKVLETQAETNMMGEQHTVWIEIMEYLAHTYYVNDNMVKSVELYRQIVAKDPNHRYAGSNIEIIDGDIDRLKREGRDLPAKPFKRRNPGELSNRDKYESLCRGEREMPLREQAKFKCYYINNSNAYLTIQPAKMEVMAFFPWVVMFHDVITDKEIEFVIKKATAQLERSGVVSGSGESDFSEYRVSSGTFFEFPYPDPHPILEKLNRRISYITGLSTKTSHPKAHAESFQVVNYGIGGVYEPHFDYALVEKNDEDVFLKGCGNRIATWMFYLSDVKAGGYTVFPEGDAYVPPVKNSAVFWYNLNKAGDGDEYTRHGGCPVLIGNKWVSNKWIHQVGQEFRAPCSSDKNGIFQDTLHV